MNNKKIIYLIIIIFFLAGLFLVLMRGQEDTWLCENGTWVKHGNPKAPTPDKPCAGSKIIDFNSCMAAGRPVMESYPRQCQGENGENFVENIGNELEKINLIRINNPRPNATVSSPLTISGQARGNWFFEGSFPVKLLDKNGQELASGIAEAKSDWMSDEFVDFSAELNFVAESGESGILVLKKDNPSGLPENDDELIVPVIFGDNNNVTLEVYFNKKDTNECNQVFKVIREVPPTVALAKAALSELIKGPTEAEKAEGYISLINFETKIQKLIIEQNVAKVDFSADLEKGVGGSCWVSGIRAEIIETLKQFASVKEVIISIDGRTEDILQP
ncbi:MAG TPA: GerMN domain-containing protein [bacterium]|nr:GerMN domain-containing protein [bacterium]HPL95833.1 GerMN domain-containing protein [bacterium]